jgi:eukaryotic-like serine/threonine-protein kinase
VQDQLDVGASATFTTTRKRPIVVAVITTLLFLGLVPRDFDYEAPSLAGELFANFLCLLCLFLAVRSWHRVLRRPVELRLTPSGLTVKRGGADLTVPWIAVGRIRIDGDIRRPWVVAWLDPTQSPVDVPARRRRDGAYKLFPVAHGQSVNKRTKKLVELRAAIMGYGRRYLDANF